MTQTADQQNPAVPQSPEAIKTETEEEKRERQEKEKRARREEGESAIAGWIISVVIMALIGLVIFIGTAGLGRSRFEVVTSAVLAKDGSGWILSGRLVHDGTPKADTQVWALAVDHLGNRFSPPVVKSDDIGGFVLAPIPAVLDAGGKKAPLEVTISSKFEILEDNITKVIRGTDHLTLGSSGQIRRVELKPFAMLLIPSIFVLSIIAAVIDVPRGRIFQSLKWYGLVTLTFAFAAVMVGYIALGLSFVNGNTSTTEVLSLGFANFYHGAYSKDTESEWLITLTSPSATQDASSGAPVLARGFGAPLWVVLLSVLGSAVFAVRVVIDGLRKPIQRWEADELRKRTQPLIEHQFFLFFSPIGAIFVYQVLVAAGAASQQMTVALAALASGIALNRVLDWAWGSVSNYLDRRSEPQSETAAAKK